MAILKGAMGYQRFTVAGEALSPEQILSKMRLFAFRPLHERGEDNESVGWSSYLSEYDHEKGLDTKDFLYGEKIILSMRFDAICLPHQLLKSLVKKSIASYQRENKKMPDRTTKKEIELAEAQGLRARVLPKTRIVEAIWCQKAAELRVFNRAAALTDRFLELFQETFLLRPSMRDFAHEAYFFAQGKGTPAAVELLSHAPIFMPPIRIDVQ